MADTPSSPPTLTLVDVRGGEAGITHLVDRFYALMDTLPEAAELRDMHPADLTTSRQKLMMFLCGWSGGPQHYIQRYGHPRLRARHMPFPIDDQASAQWMRCMGQALDEHPLPPEIREDLRKSLAHIAGHMRNR